MPNEPALDKTIISFQLPVTLKIRLGKEARRRKMSVSSLIHFLLNEGVKDIVLTSEDYEQIAKLVKNNEAKRNRKRLG